MTQYEDIQDKTFLHFSRLLKTASGEAQTDQSPSNRALLYGARHYVVMSAFEREVLSPHTFREKAQAISTLVDDHVAISPDRIGARQRVLSTAQKYTSHLSSLTPYNLDTLEDIASSLNHAAAPSTLKKPFTETSTEQLIEKLNVYQDEVGRMAHGHNVQRQVSNAGMQTDGLAARDVPERRNLKRSREPDALYSAVAMPAESVLEYSQVVDFIAGRNADLPPQDEADTASSSSARQPGLRQLLAEILAEGSQGATPPNRSPELDERTRGPAERGV